MKPEYDAIVVGGGHNGLTCAAYLARAGRRVLVLESRPVIGGLCTTEETVPEAPGFRMSPCAVDTALTNIPRSVVDELDLAKYGLRFVAPDPWASHIRPDGSSIAFWRDWRRTKAEIAHFSKKDAEAFERFTKVMLDAWWLGCAYFQAHPTRPRPKAIGEMLWRAAKGSRSLRGAAQVLISSPHQVLEEYYEREEVKAGFANLAAWSMLPLEEPGSGGCLGMMVAYFRWGVTRPVGGSGEFTRALAACVVDHGSEVRTSAPVARVDVRDDGTATGVTLASGERITARQVIGAIHPNALLGDLVDQQYIPEKVQGELRALGTLRWNLSCLKADVALERRPTLACGREELWNGYMLLSPTVEYVREAQRSCMYGILPPEIPMGPVMPSFIDRTLVPAGSTGETLYLYLPTVPVKLRGGRTWDASEAGFVSDALEILDGYAPGVKDSVIGYWAQTPPRFEEKVWGGHILHTDMSIHQMGPWRPTRSLAGYATPVDGLWHTAAGAHPMGALNGWSGRTTARSVARALGRATA
jgi:beta-carotene ketolase (CrtO type)